MHECICMCVSIHTHTIILYRLCITTYRAQHDAFPRTVSSYSLYSSRVASSVSQCDLYIFLHCNSHSGIFAFLHDFLPSDMSLAHLSPLPPI